jgi:hypothetical protein
MLKRRSIFKKAFIVACLLAAAGLAAGSPLSAQSAGTLREMTLSQSEGKTVFVIKIDGEFKYETSTLTMPRRLVVDLTPVEKITALPFLQVNASGVDSVRIGQFKPQTARVIFNLSEQNSTNSIGVMADGLRIAFGLEGEASTTAPAAAPKPARSIPQEEVAKAVNPAGDADSRLNFFFKASAGASLFLMPDRTYRREFSIYDELGAIDETYAFKTTAVFEGGFGKYFALGSSRLKVGLSAAFWSLPNEGSFTLTIPHPTLANSPRTVTFSEASALKTNLMNFYAYVLFPFLDNESVSIFFGPVLGYCSGSILTLDDIDISEKSPYSSADVTVSNPTYFKDTVSELLYGASLSFEFHLGSVASIVFDTKMIYINPKITNLGLRANMLQLQPTLGIQLSF